MTEIAEFLPAPAPDIGAGGFGGHDNGADFVVQKPQTLPPRQHENGHIPAGGSGQGWRLPLQAEVSVLHAGAGQSGAARKPKDDGALQIG
ncbi:MULTISPECIES: hypothetical protein [unclassified Cupriavidus]|uniref:hypothetical protein n=1 Tax=unclassified Cupriavidus TaxID=2640874 RepID=UPI001C00652D|nr:MULTISPECIES: hypothetical protein [unclassified Cupriavidus]MCA3184341.1 hypothetical protein [Cupriavidus sp.]MCA3190804.1 hypothetical protein [Cupriavidus sp.]MCA3199109.1 hypothetical protein [Cupriavidus sp.]MCA3205046.1 hypothetical protein [Cupriavidus sp.]MCA3209117.1 hypothetical protein [Cupriavidus sp.]